MALHTHGLAMDVFLDFNVCVSVPAMESGGGTET